MTTQREDPALQDRADEAAAEAERAWINAFCAAQPAATHVVQWGASDVWKVGGKVFAVCGRDGVTFKTTEIGFDALQDRAGVIPAPYLASRGMSWLQRRHDSADTPGSMDRAELEDCLGRSHALVVAGLTRKARRALGLEGEA